MSPTFFAGAAARSIMPRPELINNSLHSNMTVRLDQPGSPVQAKALFLAFNGQPRLLLALDLVEASSSHCRLLRERIAAATQVPAQDILITCSHSHSTPFFEPLSAAHPYFDFVTGQSVAAALQASQERRKARFGTGQTEAPGNSFNTRIPLPDGGVKFARDFREGLASGRPVDPRLTMMRIDDDAGRPIAGWVRFAAHPACVIFNTPLSAEYPGYLTARLSETVAAGAPVLFGYGASGDVNCIPMFGQESDTARLGRKLADLAAPVFEQIRTRPPARFVSSQRDLELPLEPVPSPEALDQDIAAVRAFIAALDTQPELEWVLGINCKKEWPPAAKKAHAAPLAEWAQLMKQAIASGRRFPAAWPATICAWLIDDLGLVFYPGEPFTELGLELQARSPLQTTLLLAMSNGSDAYLGTDPDRRRGGYELYTSVRYAKLAEGRRPLPYAAGAGELFLGQTLGLIAEMSEG